MNCVGGGPLRALQGLWAICFWRLKDFNSEADGDKDVEVDNISNNRTSYVRTAAVRVMKNMLFNSPALPTEVRKDLVHLLTPTAYLS